MGKGWVSGRVLEQHEVVETTTRLNSLWQSGEHTDWRGRVATYCKGLLNAKQRSMDLIRKAAGSH